MEWYKLLDNPLAITSLYNQVPALESLELFSIALSSDGPSLKLRVDLNSFPDRPPSRWGAYVNTVQAHFNFQGLKDFNAKGWYPSMLIDINITKEKTFHLLVNITNPELSINFSFTCETFGIDKFSVYHNGLR